MDSFQEEAAICRCTIEEVVGLMDEIATMEGGSFDSNVVRNWFSKSDRFLAAVFRDRMIGAVSYSTKGIEDVKMPVLDFVNVLRPFQRKGIATRLCIAAVDDLVRDGYTPIRCSTLTPASHQFILSLPDDTRIHLVIKKAF